MPDTDFKCKSNMSLYSYVVNARAYNKYFREREREKERETERETDKTCAFNRQRCRLEKLELQIIQDWFGLCFMAYQLRVI